MNMRSYPAHRATRRLAGPPGRAERDKWRWIGCRAGDDPDAIGGRRSALTADDAKARHLPGQFQKTVCAHPARQAGDVEPRQQPHSFLHLVPTRRAGCHALAPPADAGRRPRRGHDPPAYDEQAAQPLGGFEVRVPEQEAQRKREACCGHAGFTDWRPGSSRR
jgi:hypothetical protein